RLFRMSCRCNVFRLDTAPRTEGFRIIMRRKISYLLAGAAWVSAPAAQATEVEAFAADAIVVSAARSALPSNALPLTIDVIDMESLAQQAAISGSVVDAVATLIPSFSPTRQKLSGSGETLRGRSPLFAINGIPQSTPLRDGSR